MLAQVWQLSEAVRLRPEAFGGMAFHRRRGITLEVDTDAYHFLISFFEPRTLPPPDRHGARLVPQLVGLGFLTPAQVGQEPEQPPSDIPWCGDGFTLSAPETVHLAITARCNLSCPGCYVPRIDIGSQLTPEELRGLIDQWARMRVFQLAVGGGEPLLYDGLFDVLTYARERGMVPNLTTNGKLLDADVVRRLERAGVARVNLSWNGTGRAWRGQDRSDTQVLRMLLASSLQVGVNLIVTQAELPRLSRVLARLHTLGVRHVTILRPKPPAISSETSAIWYATNRLRCSDLLRLRDVLAAWQGILHLEVGSALVGLMAEANPALLHWRGVYGCAAGRRICTVWPDGCVTPCSFLTDCSGSSPSRKSFIAGNVHQAPFAELWARGTNWEELRDTAARPQGDCVGCAAAQQCGGVRCVARYERGDPSAGDAECPSWQAQTSFVP
jgi:radical SAM protein with 4Fe4S-binding SPASM domain